ncbi:MAG: hypothetical protein ACK5OW_01240 [bacterium]|jgi:hypothetical protein
MATGRNISQNQPFKGQPNMRRGAGPVYYKWKPLPFEKGGNLKQTGLKLICDNVVDNITTYVYDIDPANGNHLAYVNCDYVE